jgi:23S rRNA (adenine-N6)-dimethyltransferase
VVERSRHASRGALGQHSLRSELLAAELVLQAGVTRDDVVWEIGAGSGRLTHALAHRARRVIAVELDPRAVERLRRVFRGVDDVTIVRGDALAVPLPGERFRVFGNVPFGATTGLMRRLLDDQSSPIEAVDVVVQLDVARKRARQVPGNLLSALWAPWWLASVGRRLAPSDFVPPPSVSAALLSYRRRDPALLPASERAAYSSMLRTVFGNGGGPIGRTLRAFVPRRSLADAARDADVDLGARASEVEIDRWSGLFLALRRTTGGGLRR